ncbi:hypothetical protein N7456_001353 [Penicillium angulare]|uniref:Uncharacterized protein n=1 Tax=Penicillium angulare TaxID=116970 RepID=A0A9W9KT00_9EURO|nr:hypothetical protein N7456_001353 [Penicillium angulare]
MSPIKYATWKDSEIYKEYLDRGRAGTLRLPPYEHNDEGMVIVNPGEAFCRVQSCEKQREPLPTLMRQHVKRHGINVAPIVKGKVPLLAQDKVLEWYKALLASSDTTTTSESLITDDNGKKSEEGQSKAEGETTTPTKEET